jgi:hypothetical protein
MELHDCLSFTVDPFLVVWDHAWPRAALKQQLPIAERYTYEHWPL